MLIKITKKLNRNILHCTRSDGSYTRSELGSQLPFHDIAHYVTDKKLGIKEGFYGLIAKGYSIEKLSDKEAIKTLGVEAYVSEIFARAIGSLYTGACSIDQFMPLVYTEMNAWNRADAIPVHDENTIHEMLAEYTTLLQKWRELPDGGSIEMEF